MIVIVSDKGIPPLSSTAVVTMLITDDNPRPYLEQTPVINIQEHTLIEDSIVRVKAYDGVNANGVVKECDCLFRLDTNRGMIDFLIFLCFHPMGEEVFWLKSLYQLGFVCFFDFYFWIREGGF